MHQYARIIGKLLSHYMPPSKHWWHITLQVSVRGLTTTPFPIAGQHLEVILDLSTHRMVIDSSEGWNLEMPLAGRGTKELCDRLTAVLASSGVELMPNLLADFKSEEILPYEVQAIDRYRRVINWVNTVFRRFKGGLRRETGPVQLFPHHMDISMNWFSGRLVPGIDPANEENVDEQLNFGFLTGDDSISDAYFYVTPYPAPENWTDLALPEGACWHTEGWTGAIMPYGAVVSADQPEAALLDYLERLQAHGAKLMV
ncbi:MAG: hypothetical protein GY703_10420 [Gammaproteobacteria bacterium]|nr:hypothetical protein [Gammaproteobacteria bacterium]